MTSRSIADGHENSILTLGAPPRPDPGPMLEAIAALAARWFRVPRVLILLDNRLAPGLRSVFGILDGWTEREAAICFHTFAGQGTLVVGNLAKDARFSGHPLVTAPSGIRFYAGCPVTGPSGEIRGTICVMDYRPRRFDRHRRRLLEDLAELAARHLSGCMCAPRAPADPMAFDAGERRYRELFANTTDIVFMHDLAGRLTAVNRAGEHLTGYSRDELLEMSIADLVSPADEETARQMILEQFGAGSSQNYRMAFRTKQGRSIDVEVNAHLLFERGRPVGLMGFAREVTGRNQERTARELAEKKLREMARELIHLGVEWKQLHRLATTNYERTKDLFLDFIKTGCDVLQLSSGVIAEVSGGRCKIRASCPKEDFRGWKSEIPLAQTCFGRTVSWGRTCEYGVRQPRMARPIFAPRAAAFAICTPIYVGRKIYGVLGFASRQSREQLSPRRKEIIEFLASYLGEHLLVEELEETSLDSLTGLPNARAIEESLAESLRRARDGDTRLAAVLVDVDLLKAFNDRFGHSAGDVILRGIGRRLTACLGERNHLGRLAADRFLAILNDADCPEEAERLSRKMVEAVRRPFEVKGKRVSVSVSAGVSIYPLHGRTSKSLLENADVALRIVKHRGRNGLEIFSPGRWPEPLAKAQLLEDLQQALENREFRLRFQPEFQIDGSLGGLEVLLAWRHPKLGVLSAGRFIPVAEGSGIIVPIGTWVLREACRQYAAWRDAGHPPVKIAVNVSAVQVERPGFPELVSGALSDQGLDPAVLELEITESAVMRDVGQSVRTMNRLRELGVSLTIDDFGTGYSSLSYLSRLPVNTVKIDQSFLHEADPPESALPIISAIVSLAHDLGLTVVGEGVEKASHFGVLRSAGCDKVQGYLFGHPLSEAGATRLLKSREAPLFTTLLNSSK